MDNDELFCPITLEKFTYPVILNPCGHTFDKDAIDNAFESSGNKNCPICKQKSDGNTNLINRQIASLLNLDIKVSKDEQNKKIKAPKWGFSGSNIIENYMSRDNERNQRQELKPTIKKPVIMRQNKSISGITRRA